MPVLPALKMGGQEDCLELETSLSQRDLRFYLQTPKEGLERYQWLRAPDALADDPGSVPSTAWQHTIIYI